MTDEVRYERVGAAAVLTIDRPHRRNAVDGPTAERLLEGVEAFEADDGARVLVLTGAGAISFCSGADLKALDTYAGRLSLPDGPMGFTRRTPTKPTIAAIGGWCLAGGLELALWCDLRVAAEGSMLGFPERRWGVPLIDGGTQRLPRIVGLGRALDLILSGRLVGTEEALAMGLLTEVVPAGEHLDAGAGDGRGPRGLSSGDDARRSPRRPGGLRPAAGRRARAGGAGRPRGLRRRRRRRRSVRGRRGARRSRDRRIGLATPGRSPL